MDGREGVTRTMRFLLGRDLFILCFFRLLPPKVVLENEAKADWVFLPWRCLFSLDVKWYPEFYEKGTKLAICNVNMCPLRTI